VKDLRRRAGGYWRGGIHTGTGEDKEAIRRRDGGGGCAVSIVQVVRGPGGGKKVRCGSTIRRAIS